MLISRRTPRSKHSNLDSITCLLCQWRSFGNSARFLAERETQLPAPPSTASALDDAPRAHGKALKEFTPKPLTRPIGLPKPPRAGENAGIDTRTWKQKRDDFVDYDKHLVRRKELTQKISTPYFREWSNMRLHKGKSFLAPPKLFKAERALYFPNLLGRTLLKNKQFSDTTPTLEDKVSVVSVFSSAWAENQAATFASERANLELHQAVTSSSGIAQIVRINIEENALKNMIIRLFMPRLRRRYKVDDWGRYFVVRRGVTEEIRNAIGLLNSKVGYTYLLDGKCRIRWAASGPAKEDEKAGLIRGVRRLIEEVRKPNGQISPSQKRAVKSGDDKSRTVTASATAQ